MDYQEYLSEYIFGLFKNQIKVFVIPYVTCLRPLHVYIVDLGKVLNQFINVRPSVRTEINLTRIFGLHWWHKNATRKLCSGKILSKFNHFHLPVQLSFESSISLEGGHREEPNFT